MKDFQTSAILTDVIDIIFRYVPDDLAREDIYSELVHVFGGDEQLLETALGIDSVYDNIFKETFNEEDEEDV